MKHTNLLQYITNYITLTEPEEELIISGTSAKTYLKNQYIVQQGDVCKSIFFINKGTTRTFYASGDGQEHIVAFAIEDWWTADLGSYISQTPADYNVQCLESTEVIQFTYAALENLYLKIPKLERLFRKIVEHAYVSSQKRVIRSFSLSAKERYLIFKKNYPKIEQRIPQYMIASYLGITKEFLSKVRSQIIQQQ